MKNSSLHILRVGIAITFLWIGILIFRDPAGWAGYLQPWAANLLPFPVKTAMLGIAMFDIMVGTFLLIDYFTFWAALFASLHLISVLTVSGIDAVTVRDIGLLSATLTLVISNFPKNFRF